MTKKISVPHDLVIHLSLQSDFKFCDKDVRDRLFVSDLVNMLRIANNNKE